MLLYGNFMFYLCKIFASIVHLYLSRRSASVWVCVYAFTHNFYYLLANEFVTRAIKMQISAAQQKCLLPLNVFYLINACLVAKKWVYLLLRKQKWNFNCRNYMKWAEIISRNVGSIFMRIKYEEIKCQSSDYDIYIE